MNNILHCLECGSTLEGVHYEHCPITSNFVEEVRKQARSEALEDALKAVGHTCIAKTDKSIDFDVGFSWGIKVAMKKIEELKALKGEG